MWKPIKPKKFKKSIFTMNGISKQTIENHLKLYKGYVNKTNEIMAKLKNIDLSTANQTFSHFRSLKVDLTFALGGVKNHEIYFDHLGREGGEPKRLMAKVIKKHFGSYSSWVKDLKATGLSARGWVWLAYDRRWNRWFNYLGDARNTYPVWDCSVILALDTYEHAYWTDYGPNRASYIDAFLANLDWDVIEKNVKSWGIK